MPLKYKMGTEEYNNWFREYRKRNAKKLRKYNSEYNKTWREKNGYHNEENSHKKYPEKQLARRLFRYAVKTGKIKRDNCEVCKKPNAQGHHDDYYKPLDVRWFCPLHHKEYHKKISTGKSLLANIDI